MVPLNNAAKPSLILFNYLTNVDNLTKQQIVPTTIYLPLIALVLNLRKSSIFNKLEIFKASNVPRHTITITAVIFLIWKKVEKQDDMRNVRRLPHHYHIFQVCTVYSISRGSGGSVRTHSTSTFTGDQIGRGDKLIETFFFVSFSSITLGAR